jgi:hypothetical protein
MTIACCKLPPKLSLKLTGVSLFVCEIVPSTQIDSRIGFCEKQLNDFGLVRQVED